jgi:hypothetical protein
MACLCLMAAAALVLAAPAGARTQPQTEAVFRSCLLHHGALKVTLPHGADKANGYVWFRGPLTSTWHDHVGYWGVRWPRSHSTPPPTRSPTT